MDKYPKNPNETENNNKDNSANNPVPNDGELTQEQIEAKLAQEVYQKFLDIFPTPQHCMEFQQYLTECFYCIRPDKIQGDDKPIIAYNCLNGDFYDIFRTIHPLK